ncbi:MAG: hypothetical protein QXQ11_05395 [Candidatus Bathyarchaeia archaeon]|nr:hypothetical protein [Candidatus Bathyarchaeota archaeon]
MNESTRYSLTKCAALFVCMVALGNLLAFIYIKVGYAHPQVAMDFSHLATAIVSIHLGPAIGMIAGGLIGIVPYYRFGVAGWLGPFLGFIGIIIGKALSGLSFGIFSKRVRPFQAVIAGFIPESIFTYVVLKYFTHILLPPQIASGFTDNLITFILSRSWIGILVVGLIVDILKRKRIVENVLAT